MLVCLLAKANKQQKLLNTPSWGCNHVRNRHYYYCKKKCNFLCRTTALTVRSCKFSGVCKSGIYCRLQWCSVRDGGKPQNVCFYDRKPMWHMIEALYCCLIWAEGFVLLALFLLFRAGTMQQQTLLIMRLIRNVCIFKLLIKLAFCRLLYMCMNNIS